MGRTSKRIPGILRLVEHNGRVRRDESVVIVTDHNKSGYAGLVAGAVTGSGAEPVICEMPPRCSDGAEPPPPVAAAMLTADVIFTPVSRSITHTRAMRAALDRGARAVLMTHHDDDTLTARSLLVTNFAEQAGTCEQVGAALAGAHTVRITAPGGTDVTFDLVVDRLPNILTGQPEPGQLAPVPTIEVNVVPAEGTAQGMIVADCSVPYLGIGLLEEPITCTVRDGFVVDTTGGRQADVLRQDWAGHGDRNCYNVAELGIGLNPNAVPTGTMLEDEGILGTVHFGIGTSHTLGGTIVAPTHYDLLVWHPTITVDGRVIFQGATIRC